MKRTIYNLSMFAIAPFVGLAYIFALPLIGLACILWLGSVKLMSAELRHTLIETLQTA